MNGSRTLKNSSGSKVTWKRKKGLNNFSPVGPYVTVLVCNIQCNFKILKHYWWLTAITSCDRALFSSVTSPQMLYLIVIDLFLTESSTDSGAWSSGYVLFPVLMISTWGGFVLGWKLPYLIITPTIIPGKIYILIYTSSESGYKCHLHTKLHRQCVQWAEIWLGNLHNVQRSFYQARWIHLPCFPFIVKLAKLPGYMGILLSCRSNKIYQYL